MPVFHRSRDGSDATVETVQDGQARTFRLGREGVMFLTEILQLRDGDECRPSDLQLLIDRGWAEFQPEAPEPEPTPAPTPVPPPRPAVAPSAPSAPPVSPGITRPVVRRPASSPAPVPPPRTVPPPQRVTTPDPTAGPPLARRTRGREVALQVLYLMEQNAGVASTEMDKFIHRRIRDPKLVEFTRSLVEGVSARRPSIDELIGQVAENWRLDRMAAIDRNILRLGAFEMLHCPDVPRKVAINEALELAKRYSTAQSSRFVNGILDRLHATAEAGPTEPPAPAGEPTADEG